MTRRIGDILAQRPAKAMAGRARELAALMELVRNEHPIVAHVHGLPGIGKSTLSQSFATHARGAGASVVTLDCRGIEPTERGFLHALGAVARIEIADVGEAAERLGSLGSRVILLLDEFQQLRLIDTWLCRIFIPALSENVRLALFGRLPPAPHWLTVPAWQGLFATLHLDTLSDADARTLLRDAGVREEDVARISAFGHGHPLALHLAAMAMRERPGLDVADIAMPAVIARLADLTLADIADAALRRAVEASSLLRRVTEPLLAAIFPQEDAVSLHARLRELPFIEQLHDGLSLHDAVRGAIALSFKAADPEGTRRCRAAARGHLRGQARGAAVADLWRNTADTIYLLENPVIRDAFFPRDRQALTVAPAQTGDAQGILALTARHDGPQAVSQIASWWKRQRDAFHVVHDEHQGIVGFYCLTTLERADPLLLVEDPVAAAWWRHVRDEPVPRGQKVMLLRRWLAADAGEAQGPVQAACWLDIKRTYLELRPALRRVYLTLRDLIPYAPVAGTLGFRVLDVPAPAFDGAAYHSAMLDFGPASVDGWIAGLLGAELGAEEAGLLDVGARELVLDRRRIALTHKEFSLLQYLYTNGDRAVSRDELLNDVWGWRVDGGSNVVDALVLAVRRKLGPRAAMIETVRGVGYRFRGTDRRPVA